MREYFTKCATPFQCIIFYYYKKKHTVPTLTSTLLARSRHASDCPASKAAF